MLVYILGKTRTVQYLFCYTRLFKTLFARVCVVCVYDNRRVLKPRVLAHRVRRAVAGLRSDSSGMVLAVFDLREPLSMACAKGLPLLSTSQPRID